MIEKVYDFLEIEKEIKKETIKRKYIPHMRHKAKNGL
jgi:hypothetical protein